MSIPDVIEEVNLLLLREQCGSDAMDRGISPTLVIESTLLIKVFEKFGICLASPKVEIRDLKVAPEVTQIVRLSSIIREKSHRVAGSHKARISINKRLYNVP
jgi:hypothetical protein